MKTEREVVGGSMKNIERHWRTDWKASQQSCYVWM